MGFSCSSPKHSNWRGEEVRDERCPLLRNPPNRVGVGFKRGLRRARRELRRSLTGVAADSCGRHGTWVPQNLAPAATTAELDVSLHSENLCVPENWMEVATEALKLPNLMVELYGDLAKPGVSQAGKALGTVIGLGNTVLWPIALINGKADTALKANLELYRRKMEDVPLSEVTEVRPELGVPIAERLSFVADGRLAQLYVNLLAKASTRDGCALAHPGFVSIIENLSPDEAVLLGNLRSMDVLRICEARALAPESGPGYSHIRSHLLEPTVTEGMTFPQNHSSYVSNLAGLGLLDVAYDRYTDDEAVYTSISDAHRKAMEEALRTKEHLVNLELQFERGVGALTDLGKAFLAACVGERTSTDMPDVSRPEG